MEAKGDWGRAGRGKEVVETEAEETAALEKGGGEREEGGVAGKGALEKEDPVKEDLAMAEAARTEEGREGCTSGCSADPQTRSTRRCRHRGNTRPPARRSTGRPRCRYRPSSPEGRAGCR